MTAKNVNILSPAEAETAARSQPYQNPATAPLADRLVQGFLRHGLAMVLAALLVFTALPFLAPVAMAAGWTRLGELIYTLYIPFCHQLPQRSWFLFGPKLTYTLAEIQQVYPSGDPWQLRFFHGSAEMGWKVAWSDRMISFYTMVPIFGLFYALLYRRWPAWSGISLRTLALALLPLVLDGATHLVSDGLSGVSAGGFRDTNVWLAALTGSAFPGFYAGDHFNTFNWWARLLTGLLASWGLASATFPWVGGLFRDELQRCGM